MVSLARIKHSVLSTLTKSSRTSRAYAIVMPMVYLTTFQNDEACHILGITPVLFFTSLKIWPLLTAALLEASLFQVVIDLSAMFFIDSVVYPLWGRKEYLIFLTLMNVLGSLATTFTAAIIYYATGYENIWEGTFGGFNGLQAGFSVCLWQLRPETKVNIGPIVLPFRFKSGPFIYLCSQIFMLVIGKGMLFNFIMVLYGVHFTWLYLRFYQKIDDIAGDNARGFAYVAMFPEFMHKFVEKLTKPIFKLATRMKILKADHMYDVLPVQNQPKTKSLVNITPKDMERQREKAIQALNMKLHEESTSL